jgi:hypothetical protein
MPTQLEAAQMAANVYGNLSSVRTYQNTIAIPTGWSSDAATHPEFVKVDTGTGFMARAYQRGNEIVIAYAGTTDEAGAAGEAR